MKEFFRKLYAKDGTKSVLASLISIFIGLAVGGLVVLIVGMCKESISLKGAWDGVKLIFIGIFNKNGRDPSGNLMWGFNPQNVGNMFFRATPLIMTGLSVAVAFKTGLFNIGASGQYLIGTLTSLIIALSIPVETKFGGFMVWLLAFVGAIVAGAIWGAIPGLVKAFFNINEVIACIMTNWIAAYFVTWFFDGSSFRNEEEFGKLGYIYKTSHNGVSTPKLGLDKIFEGSQINAGILIAILFAVAMYIMINKTTLGYQLKACGANRHAARYAGIKDKRNIVLSMAISGGLAAAGAALYFLGGNAEFAWETYQALPAEGFNGIPVALLALNNPIGVIFGGLFLAMLNVVGMQLSYQTAYNEYITDVIIAVIVYMSAFSLVIRLWIESRGKKKAAAVTPAAVTEAVGTETGPAQQVQDNKGEVNE